MGPRAAVRVRARGPGANAVGGCRQPISGKVLLEKHPVFCSDQASQTLGVAKSVRPLGKSRCRASSTASAGQINALRPHAQARQKTVPNGRGRGPGSGGEPCGLHGSRRSAEAHRRGAEVAGAMCSCSESHRERREEVVPRLAAPPSTPRARATTEARERTLNYASARTSGEAKHPRRGTGDPRAIAWESVRAAKLPPTTHARVCNASPRDARRKSRGRGGTMARSQAYAAKATSLNAATQRRSTRGNNVDVQRKNLR